MLLRVPLGRSFVFVLTDSILGRMPIILSHLWLATGLSAIYVVFNAVWVIASGRYIYNILDWINNPGGAVIVSVAVVVATHLVFVLFWFTTTRVRDEMCGANPRAVVGEAEKPESGAVELRSRTAEASAGSA
jgi:hypothetical protein